MLENNTTHTKCIKINKDGFTYEGVDASCPVCGKDEWLHWEEISPFDFWDYYETCSEIKPLMIESNEVIEGLRGRIYAAIDICTNCGLAVS